jgi:hypothetical protein
MLTITVTYCNGHTESSKDLSGTFQADNTGVHTWHWRANTQCKGPATALVQAALNGQTASASDSFTIQ